MSEIRTITLPTKVVMTGTTNILLGFPDEIFPELAKLHEFITGEPFMTHIMVKNQFFQTISDFVQEQYPGFPTFGSIEDHRPLPQKFLKLNEVVEKFGDTITLTKDA